MSSGQFELAVGLRMSSHPAHLEELQFSAVSPVPENDPRWQLVLRVMESQLFVSSPLLSKFLLFVCEHTLSNQAEELTERNIGVVVFQRRPDYKTTEDNIVRSYVRQLRQRLDRYFDDHRDEPVQIVIPRGGYGAVFQERLNAGLDTGVIPITRDSSQAAPVNESGLLTTQENVPVAEQESATVVAEEAASSSQPGRRFLLLALVAGILIGAAGCLYLPRIFAPVSAAHPIWATLFSPSSVTRIVTADSALATLQELSGKHATLQQYVDGSYFAQFGKSDTEEDRKLQRLSRERLTGFPDISTVAEIMELPEVRAGHVSIRSARTFSMDDAKDTNLILLGSPDSTPWVSLFEPRMNFRYVFDASVYNSYFTNAKPLPGESQDYRNSSTAPPYSTYAVLAFLPNVENSGRVLIIEGLTTAGTEAASRFLLHGDIASFLKTVPRDKDGLRPFELLLRTTNMDSSSVSVEIVAKRIY